MPFLSKLDEQESDQAVVPYDDMLHGETTFGESFTAGLGLVIDEELSISSSFNNDGYKDRESQARDLADGGFDLAPFTDDSGFIDYNSLSQATDIGMKTDVELYDERNALLDMRRSYSQDVVARGSGLAQFAGSMNGYMLDPVNIATLPLGASSSALRGLSTLARVSRVALTEGAIGTAAEIAIQPLVYAHKSEIGSPYSIEDSLMAIGTAALGGAAIGGAAQGVAGFFRNAAKIADPYALDPGAQGSKEILERAANDILQNPERNFTTTDLVEDVRFYSQKTEGEILADIELLKSEIDAAGDIPSVADYSGPEYGAANKLIQSLSNKLKAAKKKIEEIGERAQEAFDRGDTKAGEALLDEKEAARKAARALDDEFEAAQKSRSDQPKAEPADPRMRLEAAQAVLESRTGRWKKKVDEDIAQAVGEEKARLLEGTGERISRGERKQLAKDINQLIDARNKIEVAELDVKKGKGKSARKAKSDAIKKVEAEAAGERKVLQDQIDVLETRMESARRGSAAEAELTRTEQGLFGSRLQSLIRELSHRRLVEVDINYYRTMEQTKLGQNTKLATPDQYRVASDPDQDGVVVDTDVADYEAQDIARFEAMEGDGVILKDGEVHNAREFIEEQDELMSGLESVKVCKIG